VIISFSRRPLPHGVSFIQIIVNMAVDLIASGTCPEKDSRIKFMVDYLFCLSATNKCTTLYV
jgi:hypothetical protein